MRRLYRRRLLGAAVPVLAGVVLLATAGVSSAGYGPPVPPGPPIPGGFTAVIASKTFCQRGGVLVGRTRHTHFKLLIPRRALVRCVQLTLTHPRNAGARRAVPRHWRLLFGFALLANHPDGTAINGHFARKEKGVRIIAKDRRLRHRDRVLLWSVARHRFVKTPKHVGSHVLKFKRRRAGVFLVIARRH